MIHKVEDLKAALSAGQLLVRALPLAPESELVWSVTKTGERVHAYAMRKAFDQELIQPVTFDLAGEPFEWGAANA